MPIKFRSNPIIPDHEVLRKIGGGAYGEVWLARGVTGALRAVKVVWREDFDDERGFEREFEGILKFEPISRDHPGLVNILHVGRSPDGGAFYYYVMELGDDVRTGRDINPIEYEPRTLRADHPQAAAQPWETGDCIDVGLRLAEALHHLHEGGLAHRDVKPSNVIFVNGKAKLADIGLVAARDQRTFVGTEGFVPPEGPGSAQADIYSLGKVLYELATGKDRMNFPELPDEMPMGVDRKRWLELNRIVCDVCEPRISKRRITTAAGLAEALRRIQRGKRHRRNGTPVLLTTLLLGSFACWAVWQVIKDAAWFQSLNQSEDAAKQHDGLLRVFSTPEGADVLDANGVMVGTTPTPTMTAQVGEEVVFTLRKDGFKSVEVRDRVPKSAVGEPMTLYAQMAIYSPPQIGEPWADQLGVSYQPIDDHHLSSTYVTKDIWSGCKKLAKPAGNQAQVLSFTENGQVQNVILTNEATAKIFCGWLRTSGIEAGYLTGDHEVIPLLDKGFNQAGMNDLARQHELRPFRVKVRKIVYGQLRLTSSQPGAEVYINGQAVGSMQDSLMIPNVKPGVVDVLLVLEGYKPMARKLNLAEGQTIEENLILEKNQGIVFGRPWENGIHIKFVPMGEDLMVSIWETRVRDYQLFCKETGRAAARVPHFDQDENHPVVNVSREDAQAFCEWLTAREIKAERISGFHVYRLPTDLEWSRIAGLNEEEGISPNWRDARKQAVFPWGASWPDSGKVGNFSDIAAWVRGVENERTISGYDDGYPFTAPVGSFPANSLGIFDLSGNVQEWVEDEFSKYDSNVLGVLRGGGWNTYQLENLYIGSRNAVPPKYQDEMYGFRVVLSKVPVKSD